jgi:hypothetical protein
MSLNEYMNQQNVKCPLCSKNAEWITNTYIRKKMIYKEHWQCLHCEIVFTIYA